MKLTILIDNHTYINQYYLGEPAACYLIEDGESNILLDMGYSDAFLKNAERMGIDLGCVTDIVLSHGHNDHTGGLPAFFSCFSQKVRVFAHPNALLPKRHDGLDVGSPLSLAELQAYAEVTLSASPCSVSDHITFLGEIPRVYPFEEGCAVGESPSAFDGCWEVDRLVDDSSLALALPDGLFVVAGCAHAGICNTVLYAKQMTGLERVNGILGGFHLFETGETLKKTLRTLQNLGVMRVYPAHCTSLAVKSAFVRSFETIEVGVGLTLAW